MGKHLDKLKTGDPNRKVSTQELINVLGEYFQESTEMLKEAQKEIFKSKPKKIDYLKQLRKRSR